MDAQPNWDDLRVILAVAEAQSLAGAARALGLDHATVLRRVARFEARHGLTLFERSPRGYRLAPDRRDLLEAMREAAQAMQGVDRMIGRMRPAPGSGLRVATTDSLAAGPLAAILSDLAEAGERVNLAAGNAHVALDRREADIVVRPAPRLPPEARGEAPVAFRFAVYARDAEVAGWLGLSGPLGRSAAAGWVEARDTAPRLRADSFLTLAALAAAGRGRTLLPRFLGDADPGLARLDLPDDLAPVPIWVASHRDVYRSGRLRRARAAICEGLAALGGALEPRTG